MTASSVIMAIGDALTKIEDIIKRKVPEFFTQPFAFRKSLTCCYCKCICLQFTPNSIKASSLEDAKSKSPNKFSNIFSHDDVLTNIGLASPPASEKKILYTPCRD